MTLAVTNITTTMARNAIAESINAIKQLCTSGNINEWSLHKPADYGAGNDAWTVDSGGVSGYVKPIGVSSDSSGHRLGDFRGYNHDANPPRYFNGNYTFSYYKYETLSAFVTVQKGEMEATSNGDGFNPSYHDVEDSGFSLLGLQLSLSGTLWASITELFDSTTYQTISLSGLTKGTYTMICYYFNRTVINQTWVQRNAIEGGSVTLTITELSAKFTITALSIDPDTVTVLIGHSYIDAIFTIDFTVRNDTTSSFSYSFYWEIATESGIITVANAANETKNYQIVTDYARCYTPSELFQMRINNSSGEILSGGSIEVTVNDE